MASCVLMSDYTGAMSAQPKEYPALNSGAKAAVYRFQRVRETGVVNKPANKGSQIMAIPGDNVRRLRQEKGWSMRELAERCVTEEKTMDHTTIMRLENNKGFTQPTLERVAAALGLKNYQDLFTPTELAGWEKLDETDRSQVKNMIEALVFSSEKRKAVCQ